MKKYILTATVKIDEDHIESARRWEKRKGLQYGDEIAHLVFDCMTDGQLQGFEIESTDMDVEK